MKRDLTNSERYLLETLAASRARGARWVPLRGASVRVADTLSAYALVDLRSGNVAKITSAGFAKLST